MTTAEYAILGTGAGASLLALSGAFIWRLGVEFERAWLRAMAAPPEPFEAELNEALLAEQRQNLRCEAARTSTILAVREPALV